MPTPTWAWRQPVEFVPDLDDEAAKAAALGVMEATVPLWVDAAGSVSWQLDLPAFEAMSVLFADTNLTDGRVDPAAAVRVLA